MERWTRILVLSAALVAPALNTACPAASPGADEAVILAPGKPSDVADLRGTGIDRVQAVPNTGATDVAPALRSLRQHSTVCIGKGDFHLRATVLLEDIGGRGAGVVFDGGVIALDDPEWGAVLNGRLFVINGFKFKFLFRSASRTWRSGRGWSGDDRLLRLTICGSILRDLLLVSPWAAIEFGEQGIGSLEPRDSLNDLQRWRHHQDRWQALDVKVLNELFMFVRVDSYRDVILIDELDDARIDEGRLLHPLAIHAPVRGKLHQNRTALSSRLLK